MTGINLPTKTINMRLKLQNIIYIYQPIITNGILFCADSQIHDTRSVQFYSRITLANKLSDDNGYIV